MTGDEKGTPIASAPESRVIGATREAVRVRLHEELEGRLPIASRCGITCALEDGLTDSVGHGTPTIAERSNEVEPPPGRNRGSYRP